MLKGRRRVEADRFVALRSHYLFESQFTTPGLAGAHEKGGVEGEVGRFRRNHLVPVPAVATISELNALILAGCEADLGRRVTGRAETVGEALARERPLLGVLPDVCFDAAETATPRVDAKALVTVRQNRYSVPARLAGLRVGARIGAREITISHAGAVVARHERLHGRFGIRTPPSPGDDEGRRYWRYVELASGDLETNDLEILRRIDPTGGEPVADGLGEVDLEAAWQRAAGDVVEAHNRRTDVREEQEAIGPRQRWALDVLRAPSVAYAPGAEQAEEALSVSRSSAVRRAIGAIETSVHAGDLTSDQAALAIVDVVDQFGLQAVEELPQRVTLDDLGVVCWMAVLPPSS